MHDTAQLTGEQFFKVYGKKRDRILDVGSLDVNGTLRPFAPEWTEYVGIDTEKGNGVDVILDDPYQFPFPNESFDLVVSTSSFEHIDFFWLSFLEIVRVTKPNGFIYMSAPTGGGVHRYPVDSWRFYPDAGHSLTSWAIRNKYFISLCESFILPPGQEGWSDFVAVWSKSYSGLVDQTIVSKFPHAQHAFVAS